MKRVTAGIFLALCLIGLTLLLPKPAVGDPAPAFALPSDRGETVSLADFRGKSLVVLAFYPKDRTRGCTQEMQAFTRDLPRFRAAGAVVLGVSVDSIASHQDFVLHCALGVPLLSDIRGTVAGAYGAAYPLVGITRRKTFLIDRQGVVRTIVNGMPKNDRLLRELAAIGRG